MTLSLLPTKKPTPVAVAAKKAAKDAAVGYGRYVKARPDSRLPAGFLVLLYPLGHFGYLVGFVPALTVAFVPVAALPFWVVLHKVYGDCRYTRVVTGSVALVPVWLAVAAVTGVFRMSVLLGYCMVAGTLWATYARCEVLSERRSRRQAQIEWAAFSVTVGLAGAGLREVTQTRLGAEYKLDVRGTGRLASRWVKSDLAETWAAQRSLPPSSRVVVRHDPDHAGQVFVEERTRHPWEETNGHPTLDPDSEWSLPAVRSIHDGPLEVGADPTSGKVLSLPVYEKKRGKHVMVVATTGGGKTVLANNLIERATACTDVLVWPIDVVKGTLPSIWNKAADWSAGVGDYAGAMRILRGAKTVIEQRSAASGGRNHNATPTAPFIMIPLDEAGKLTGRNGVADLLGFIETAGSSAGVEVVYISQRGALQHAGTMDVKANSAIRACLRVTQTSEMSHILPDWYEDGCPDMSTFGQGSAGVVAIQIEGGRFTAGRTWDLSDLDAVEALAGRRGAPKATLEPDIAVRLGEAYATRRHVVQMALAVEEDTVPVWDADRELQDLVADSRARIDGSVQELAALQIPKGQETSLEALVQARDEHLRVMDLLRQAGPNGMSRSELAAASGVNVNTLKSWLKVLKDKGQVEHRGVTSNARYVIPDAG